MKEIHIAVDLNLLRVFDILMEMRSVSRTADRLGLTQSAVSHALGRLRGQFGDPLFVRSRGGLRPTPRARAIAPAIRDGLSLLRDAISKTAFRPATATRTFTISAGSYYCVTLLPIVIRHARAEAPLAQFRIVAPNDGLVAELDEGLVDLALGAFGRAPARLIRRTLLTESFEWVGRIDADGRDPATRPQLTLVRGSGSSAGDEMITRGGLEYRSGLTTLPDSPLIGPSYLAIHDPLSAGAFILSSDLAALLPRQLARLVTNQAGIGVLDIASEERVDLSMLWHTRWTDDPAHVWLRGLFDAASHALA